MLRAQGPAVQERNKASAKASTKNATRRAFAVIVVGRLSDVPCVATHDAWLEVAG